MKVVSLFALIDEVHAIGLQQAQGLYVADSWWWDRDDESRAWSRRFFDRFNRMPSSLHAADYSAASQCLTAVAAVGGADADEVLARMRARTINDAYARNGRVRGDGLMVHDMYLLRIKSPARSAGPWDYYELVETFQGDAAWATRAESRCARWR